MEKDSNPPINKLSKYLSIMNAIYIAIGIFLISSWCIRNDECQGYITAIIDAVIHFLVSVLRY